MLWLGRVLRSGGYAAAEVRDLGAVAQLLMLVLGHLCEELDVCL